MRIRRLTTAALFAAALILVGCGGPADPTTDAPTEKMKAEEPGPPSAQPSAPPTQSIPPVPDELDFTAPTIDGGTFEGASLVGRPAVL